MAKSFTINAPEYQKAQKKFYAYNVANDPSAMTAGNIKHIDFPFNLSPSTLTVISMLANDETLEHTYCYALDEENSKSLLAFKDFYVSHKDKIMSMSAYADYKLSMLNEPSMNGSILLADNIYTTKVDAYDFKNIKKNADNEDVIYDWFLVSMNVRAKTVQDVINILDGDYAGTNLLTLAGFGNEAVNTFAFGVISAFDNGKPVEMGSLVLDNLCCFKTGGAFLSPSETSESKLNDDANYARGYLRICYKEDEE